MKQMIDQMLLSAHNQCQTNRIKIIKNHHISLYKTKICIYILKTLRQAFDFVFFSTKFDSKTITMICFCVAKKR